MTDKELKKLGRGELLELLLEQSKELEAVQKKLEDTEKALAKKEIAIDEAGSIAEAALKLNGIFEAAEAACGQYTDNIRNLSRRQEQVCAKMEEESSEKARIILETAEKKAEKLERETEERCADMIKKAKQESQSYWDEVHSKLETVLSGHSELHKLLSSFKDCGNEE